MEPRYRLRLYILTAVIIAGCGVLLHRLYQFQIVQQENFIANVPETHTVSIFEPGIRGKITDRHNQDLATNSRAYELLFNLKEVRSAYMAERGKEVDELPPDLTGTVESPEARAKANAEDVGIDEIVDTWLMPKLQRHGLLSDARFSGAVRAHFITHGGLVPFRYPINLSYDEFARLAENSFRLPGVSVNVRALRNYPLGTLACHVVGHTASWKKDNIPEEFQKRRVHYLGQDYGIAGVEKTLNEFLTGRQGKKVIVRNEKEVVKRLEDYQPAEVGAEVQLTLDARMQLVVEDVMREIGRGSAVVMDPRTGEILAMASVPNYDPNDFIPSITGEKWRAYTANRAEPFINRAIASFTPGSTFKLPIALAACMNGQEDFHDTCIGYNTYGTNVRIRCWKQGGHGGLLMDKAIQVSCNPYFMDLATTLGATKTVEAFDLLNLGRRTGVRLPNESPGIVPGSPIWKLEIKPGSSLSRAGLAQVGIGQADSMATPLQLTAVTSAIANGGRFYQPRIVRRVLHPALPNRPEEVLIENIPIVKKNLLEEGLSTRGLEMIRRGMWLAVNEAGGTASRVRLDDVEVSAKTGTAQTGQPDHLDKNNAWTTAFAPHQEPRYAVTVMVRNGRSGGKVAGVLVHKILRGLFDLENGKGPPLEAQDLFVGNFDAYEEITLPETDPTPFSSITDQTGDVLDDDLLAPELPVRLTPNQTPSLAPVPD